MKKLALITGATSGIGRAFAERLSAEGYDLILTGRSRERLDAFSASHKNTKISTLSADLSTLEGIDAVARICANEPLAMLVNNAGVAHYMPFSELPTEKMQELLHVKIIAPTRLARSAIDGMKARGNGTIVNVAGMIAFSGPAPASTMPRRAIYGGSLAYLVTLTQLLNAELEGTGIKAQVVCPGVVATEFHTRQNLDLSAMARMSAEDVVSASLRGLEMGETVTAPGVEDRSLLDAIFKSELSAFGGQTPQLATRYRSSGA